MKKYIIGGFAAAFLVSCDAVSNVTKSSAQASLENTTWQLADNVRGKIPTLQIESGKVSGHAGCNNYFGGLTTDPTTATFSASNLGATKMACENMATEDNFLNMLPKVNRYKVSGNTLELYENSLLLLKFNKVK